MEERFRVKRKTSRPSLRARLDALEVDSNGGGELVGMVTKSSKSGRKASRVKGRHSDQALIDAEAELTDDDRRQAIERVIDAKVRQASRMLNDPGAD